MAVLIYDQKRVTIDGEAVIGRHRDCALQIEDNAASRNHARVWRDDEGAAWVEDLDSANGTRLNGKKLAAATRLNDDDCITIGRSRILFKSETSVSEGDIDPFGEADAASRTRRGAENLIGTEIGGCRLDAVIDKDSLGVTFRATQLGIDRPVAMRVLRRSALGDAPDAAERFRNAVRRAAAIDHPALARVLECGIDQGFAWCSTALVRGRNLRGLLEREGMLPPVQALLVAERVAEALDAAHRAGVVHGDVRPGNIVLGDDGGVYLLGLGWSAVVPYQAGSASRAAYQAPELTDERPADALGDVYALGCTLFHLLTGQPPYRGDDAAAVRAAHRSQATPQMHDLVEDLPPGLDQLLQGVMNKNPEWRHADMRELISELRALRATLVQGLARNDEAPRPPRRAETMPDDAAYEPPPVARSSERRAAAPDHQTMRLIKKVALTLLAVVLIALFGPSLTSAISRRNDPAEASPPPSQPTSTVRDLRTRPPSQQPQQPQQSQQQPPHAIPVGTDPHWAKARASAQQYSQDKAWGAAERTLRDFTTARGAIGDEAKRMLATVQLDGSTWYRAELAKLPALSTPGAYAQVLTLTAQLRDRAVAADVADAEARYQEALARITQELQAARRKARIALESGKPAAAPDAARAVAALLNGTPLAGVYRQFQAQADAASGVGPLLRQTWPETIAKLKTVTGDQALAAGAALLLAGETDAGKQVLMNEPTLAQGALLKSREALLGREAAVLTFQEAADLQQIEIIAGQVQLAGGKLRGTDGEAASIAVGVPIGGANWEVALRIELETAADATDAQQQATIAVTNGKGSDQVRLSIDANGTEITARAPGSTVTTRPDRPNTIPLTVRMACRDNQLVIYWNGEEQMASTVAVPADCQLQIACVGLRWAIDELQVIAGQ